MESAENREQSSNVNPSEESKDSQPSLSKVETIKLLNDSIDRLESTIKDISKNSAKNLPSSDSIETLINTTQELADSVAPSPVVEKAIPQPPEVEVAEAQTTPPVATATSDTSEAPKKETKETATPNPSPEENRGLRIIGIIAIVIAVIAVIWLLFPQTEKAISSFPEATPTEIIDSPSIGIEPSEPSLIVSPPSAKNVIAENIPTEPESTAKTPEPEPPEEIIIPPDLSSPGRAQNLKIETIEPELTFTPEQTLVAALQTKITELTSGYDSDVFDSIQVDFPNNSLLVEVTDKWYGLKESRQNKLANEVLQRSRQLQFAKLQFQDSTGTLVARNPVVGDRIIILKSIE